MLASYSEIFYSEFKLKVSIDYFSAEMKNAGLHNVYFLFIIFVEPFKNYLQKFRHKIVGS